MAINKRLFQKLLGFCLFLLVINTNGQVNELPEDKTKELTKGFKTKKFFNSIFKYSTFYAAYSENNSIQDNQSFYVTQDNELIETTERVPADQTITYGWRKLANFQYEDRNKFYRGDENNASTKSNIGNVKGLEYLFQYSKGRQQGDEFENQEAFIRYLAKWWLIKGEYKKNELVDLNYKSGEARARFQLGKKLSLSIGAIYRSYDKAYGHNPIQQYLEDNMWWNLAYDEFGYTDLLYQMVNPFTGELMGYDYQWFNQDGELVSASDADFRNGVFENLVNEYNERELAKISGFEQVSLIAGLDLYHYRSSHWIHIYGNILPYHELLSGDERYSYGNFAGDYIDYSAGAVVGVKITKNIGLFGEINLQQYWDREIRSIKAGLNIKI